MSFCKGQERPHKEANLFFVEALFCLADYRQCKNHLLHISAHSL